MFAQLYHEPSALARHLGAPYAEERARYLGHCASQGYSTVTLVAMARDLLWVARKLSAYGTLAVTVEQIAAVAQDWGEREQACGQLLNAKWCRHRFIRTARMWLRFLGCLQLSRGPVPFSERLAEYAMAMARDHGLAVTTIQQRSGVILRFLRWYGARPQSDGAIGLGEVEEFLAEGVAAGWGRQYVCHLVTCLRSFCRFGATQGWCPRALAGTIEAPRLYADEGLPRGPAWPAVQRLLASTDTDRGIDIRDRAILMLFAIYGLRASEVAQLRLEQLAWKQDQLHLCRAKGRGLQLFPLLASVGNAVARYLKEVRPSSSHRQVFLTLRPPFRPLSRAALYTVTSHRLTALGIVSAHQGPHALRHACATHLLAEGLSLKVIGDHLGHRSANATRIYAKVDLAGLREVAAFDLGDLP